MAYVFTFPDAQLFVQSLIDLNPISEYLTIAWEFNTETNKPEYLLLQAAMARQETCMTQRYEASWVLNNQLSTWTAPPIYSEPLQIDTLQLRICSCSVPTCTQIHSSNNNDHKNQILEICSFNANAIPSKVKKLLRNEHSLDQLSLQCTINLSTIEFEFIPLIEERTDEKDRIHFYTDLLKTTASLSETSTPLGEFFKQQDWTVETKKQIVTQRIKEPIIEPLIDRNLIVPTFIYPYELPPLEKQTDKKKETTTNNCSLCSLMQNQNINSFKLDSIERWQNKYDEEIKEKKSNKWLLDPSFPSFPLSPLIVNEIRNVRDQLKQTVPSSLHRDSDRVCPLIRKSLAQVDCDFLLPALQHFSRDLQLTSSLVTYAFDSNRIVLFAEGEVGSTRFDFDTIIKESNNEELLSFYKIHSCEGGPFHIEIPLRQISLFPRLTTSQNPYLCPHYVRFQIRPQYDYVQLSAKADKDKREIIQLIFTYHKLQQACLTTDVSEESPTE